MIAPRVIIHKDRYYLLNYNMDEDVKEILNGGPYYMRGHGVLVKKWDLEFDFNRDQVAGVAINCWGVDSLSWIASVVGILICEDKCTNEQTRVNYARVLVTVDVTMDKLNHVQIEGVNGSIYKQPVTYEWWPVFYKKCN